MLLYPGRTEYIEKYGRVAAELTRNGLTVLSIDWRGQGFSDRLSRNTQVGHVPRFRDYQADVAALAEFAYGIDAPRPWFLLAHSMGGCIGLRALAEGLVVERAVFSAPMWGIEIPNHFRPLAHILPPLAKAVGAGETLAPGTRPANYITETGFQENLLTTDRATYEWLGQHAEAVPEFGLGGPSVRWIGEATKETAALAKLPRPDVPVLTFLGTEEAIVSASAVERIHSNWPGAELVVIDGAKHELMMEAPALRQKFLQGAVQFFSGNTKK